MPPRPASLLLSVLIAVVGCGSAHGQSIDPWALFELAQQQEALGQTEQAARSWRAAAQALRGAGFALELAPVTQRGIELAGWADDDLVIRRSLSTWAEGRPGRPYLSEHITRLDRFAPEQERPRWTRWLMGSALRTSVASEPLLHPSGTGVLQLGGQRAEPLAFCPSGARAALVEPAPGGWMVACTTQGQSQVRLLDQSGTLRATLELTGSTPTVTRVYTGEGTYHHNIPGEAPSWATALAAAEDGTRLAVGASDGTVWLWPEPDATSPVALRLPGNEGQDRAWPDPNEPIGLSFQGERLLAVYAHGQVLGWSLAGEEPVAGPLAEHPCGRLQEAVFSPDGRHLAVRGEGLCLIDGADGRLLAQLAEGYADNPRFSADGTLAWLDSAAQWSEGVTPVQLLAPGETTPRAALRPTAFPSPPRIEGISADGRWLLMSALRALVLHDLWSQRSTRLDAAWALRTGLTEAGVPWRLDAEGLDLWGSGLDQAPRHIGAVFPIDHGEALAEGRWILRPVGDGTQALIEVASATSRETPIQRHEPATVGPDGRFWFLRADRAARRVEVCDWDPATEPSTARCRWSLEGFPSGIALSPDGARVAVLLEGARLLIGALEDEQPPGAQPGTTLADDRLGFAQSVRWHADGTRLWVLGHHQLRLVDLEGQEDVLLAATEPFGWVALSGAPGSQQVDAVGPLDQLVSLVGEGETRRLLPSGLLWAQSHRPGLWRRVTAARAGGAEGQP